MPAKGAHADLTGQTFGRLTVVAFVSRTRYRSSRWLCRCTCGREVVVEGANLKASNSASCGCLRTQMLNERSAKHGQAGRGDRSPEYQSWTSMLARVRSTSGRRFEEYGDRGITVCEPWLVFENFLADMGSRPAGTSLDRIDNDGNYEPGNCRWATPSEQNANQRRSRKNRAAVQHTA